MQDKDLYKVLGLDKNASKDDIKKSFKTLSKKWHPDKFNNKGEAEKKEAEEKFKEINEAYSTLSDPKKKQEYDMMREGGFNPFMGGMGPMWQKQAERGADIAITVPFTLEDTLKTKRIKVTFSRNIRCAKCNGTGSKDGKTNVCHMCGGSGMFTKTKQTAFGFVQQSSTCPYCGGSGVEKGAEPCPDCGGTGFHQKQVTEEIEVPLGVFDGAVMGLRTYGHESPDADGMNGNLVVKFKETKHDVFVREGKHLRLDLTLNIKEAWLGCDKEIECLDGKKIKITIPKLTKPDATFSVAGKGTYTAGDVTRQIGNLYVVVKYEIPNELTDKQVELLNELYG